MNARVKDLGEKTMMGGAQRIAMTAMGGFRKSVNYREDGGVDVKVDVGTNDQEVYQDTNGNTWVCACHDNGMFKTLDGYRVQLVSINGNGDIQTTVDSCTGWTAIDAIAYFGLAEFEAAQVA